MKLDTDGETRKLFDGAEWGRLCGFVNRELGIDLRSYGEFAGAIVLGGCNPLLRDISFRLSKNEKQLLVHFQERRGKSVTGGRLEVSDIRPMGSGFCMSAEITAPYMVIDLPYSPYQLHARVFSSDGTLLGENKATFLKTVHIKVIVSR